MSSLVRLLFAISVFTLMATLPGLDVVLPLRWGHENTPVVGKTSTMTDQQLTEIPWGLWIGYPSWLQLVLTHHRSLPSRHHLTVAFTA